MILNVRSCYIDENGGCEEYEDLADYVANPLGELNETDYYLEEWDEDRF